jgi:hypothetical protein
MQTTEKMMNIMLTRWFSFEVHLVAPSYIPVVSTTHLVVWRLIGITCQARTSGTARTYPESEGSSMTRSTRVALRDPRGVSTILLTNPPLEHRTIFSRTSTESQATKPSRRWQSLRVTSTIALQHDHLVALDATSRCNCTRIAHSLNRMNTINHKWVGGLPRTLTHGHKVPLDAQPQPWLRHPSIYSPRTK